MPRPLRALLTLSCKYCGGGFTAWPSKVQEGCAIYCSMECRKRSTDVDFTARFWAHVDKREPCWLWTASCRPTGYGQLNRHGTLLHAHRVAWELTNGPVPDGKCVLHRCDVRRCVRPDHLFLGSKKDNTQDMMAKGRARFDGKVYVRT